MPMNFKYNPVKIKTSLCMLQSCAHSDTMETGCGSCEFNLLTEIKICINFTGQTFYCNKWYFVWKVLSAWDLLLLNCLKFWFWFILKQLWLDGWLSILYFDLHGKSAQRNFMLWLESHYSKWYSLKIRKCQLRNTGCCYFFNPTFIGICSENFYNCSQVEKRIITRERSKDQQKDAKVPRVRTREHPRGSEAGALSKERDKSRERSKERVRRKSGERGISRSHPQSIEQTPSRPNDHDPPRLSPWPSRSRERSCDRASSPPVLKPRKMRSRDQAEGNKEGVQGEIGIVSSPEQQNDMANERTITREARDHSMTKTSRQRPSNSFEESNTIEEGSRAVPKRNYPEVLDRIRSKQKPRERSTSLEERSQCKDWDVASASSASSITSSSLPNIVLRLVVICCWLAYYFLGLWTFCMIVKLIGQVFGWLWFLLLVIFGFAVCVFV